MRFWTNDEENRINLMYVGISTFGWVSDLLSLHHFFFWLTSIVLSKTRVNPAEPRVWHLPTVPPTSECPPPWRRKSEEMLGSRGCVLISKYTTSNFKWGHGSYIAHDLVRTMVVCDWHEVGADPAKRAFESAARVYHCEHNLVIDN